MIPVLIIKKFSTANCLTWVYGNFFPPLRPILLRKLFKKYLLIIDYFTQILEENQPLLDDIARKIKEG